MPAVAIGVRRKENSVRSQVLVAVNMKMAVFRDAAS
jgi:hypothetical protein